MLKDPSYIYKIGNHDMYPLPFLPGLEYLPKSEERAIPMVVQDGWENPEEGAMK